MALCRCLGHPPMRNDYIGYFEPIGYPNTSSICGRSNCNNPGYIWLKENELDNFDQHHPIIKLPTFAIKVEVQNQFNFVD